MFLQWDLVVFIAALSAAVFTPGPGIAAIVAMALAGGARQAVWLCVGIIIGDLVWLALSLSGLALVASQIPLFFVVTKWAGVSYLLYLAIKFWRASPRVIDGVEKPVRAGVVARLLAGFSITMGNPKAMLFYLAILPGIIEADQLSITMVLSLCGAVVLVLSTIFSFYAFAAQKARHSMSTGRSMQVFNRITAAVFVVAAVWIASG